MENAAELWLEHRLENGSSLLGSFVRAEFLKEKVIRIDASALGHRVDRWWKNHPTRQIDDLTHSELKKEILEYMSLDYLNLLRKVGLAKSGVAALLLEHTFNISDKNLALVVHEVMSDIAGIVDVKYPYESHKELFPKNNSEIDSDWGKGLGIIRPHSDDLYESRAVNTMSLTVCKDTSCTPTWLWLLQDIVSCLTDQELGEFVLAEALYCSGKNVEGTSFVVKKPVLRKDEAEGFGLRLDFRIDPTLGARMKFESETTSKLFDRMRQCLRTIKPVSTNPSTGSISIISNYKALHGRSSLNAKMLTEGESSRILFRSKGFKESYL